MMKYTIRILSALLMLMFFVGCGGNEAEETAETAAIAVKTLEVANEDIQRVLGFFGNVEGSQAVKVYSTIPNRVTNLYVDVGEEVRKGQVLATVSADKISEGVTQAEAALEAATVQYDIAESEFQRVQKLFDENVVSQSHYDGIKAQRDAAKSTVKQAEAGLSAANSQYQDTRITSPISGVVSIKNYELGDVAAPQYPFFEIVEMNPVKVSINVIERYLGSIKPGQTATITVNSYPDEIFFGKVDIVSPTLDELTRTASADLIFDNPDLKLKPGMFANVEIITNEKQDVPVIPYYAIIEKTAIDYSSGTISTSNVLVEKSVFTVKDGMAFKKHIETGIEHNNKVEVLSGLETGETLVIQGQHILLDSSLVKIVD